MAIVVEHSIKVGKVTIGVAGVVGHDSGVGHNYIECVDECADVEDDQE